MKMTVIAAALGCAMLSSPVNAQTGEPLSVLELYMDCVPVEHHYAQGLREARDAGICIGYIQGVADAAVGVDTSICVPDETTSEDLVRSFMRFTKARLHIAADAVPPAPAYQNAVLGVAFALRQAYPCTH